MQHQPALLAAPFPPNASHPGLSHRVLATRLSESNCIWQLDRERDDNARIVRLHARNEIRVDRRRAPSSFMTPRRYLPPPSRQSTPSRPSSLVVFGSISTHHAGR
ncbi:hypothetical protein [Burkholderia sp. BCC1972]|uniref:hypothetical protein n=1 Tax=Burkholderia sp. BCC1972 TaxID=2817438 RepID=UPI002ABD8FFC|nr:hypothetical protein [Burkholderia sp. BCC1972]